VNGTSEVRLAGLVAVRIAWITAVVVCAVVILIGLFSGTDGGDSSQRLPGFAFTDGGDSSQQLPEFASFDPAAGIVGAAAEQNRTARSKDRSARAKEAAIGNGYPGPGVPPRSGSRSDGAGGGIPVVRPRPKPTQPEGNRVGAPLAPDRGPAGAPQAPQGGPGGAPQAPEGGPIPAPPGGGPAEPPQEPEVPSPEKPKPLKPPKPPTG
jgi:hypothetical protein